MAITQDLSQLLAVILADKVFIFSKQDINITANLKFNQETYTCSYSENQEVFSFIQSRAQSNNGTVITEDVLKQNYIN